MEIDTSVSSWNSDEDIPISELTKLAIENCSGDPIEEFEVLKRRIDTFVKKHPKAVSEAYRCLETLLKGPTICYYTIYWLYLIDLHLEELNNEHNVKQSERLTEEERSQFQDAKYLKEVRKICDIYMEASKALPGSKKLMESALSFLVRIGSGSSRILQQHLFFDLIALQGCKPQSTDFWKSFLEMVSKMADDAESAQNLLMDTLEALATVHIRGATTVISTYLLHPIFQNMDSSDIQSRHQELLQKISNSSPAFIEMTALQEQWIKDISNANSLVLDYIEDTDWKEEPQDLRLDLGKKSWIFVNEAAKTFCTQFASLCQGVASNAKFTLNETTSQHIHILGVDKRCYLYRIALKQLLKAGRYLAAQMILLDYFHILIPLYRSLTQELLPYENDAIAIVKKDPTEQEKGAKEEFSIGSTISKYITSLKEIVQTKMMNSTSLSNSVNNQILMALIEEEMWGPDLENETKCDAVNLAIDRLSLALSGGYYEFDGCFDANYIKQLHLQWKLRPPAQIVVFLVFLKFDEKISDLRANNYFSMPLGEIETVIAGTETLLKDIRAFSMHFCKIWTKAFEASQMADSDFLEYYTIWNNRMEYEMAYLSNLEGIEKSLRKRYENSPAVEALLQAVQDKKLYHLLLLKGVYETEVSHFPKRVEFWQQYMTFCLDSIGNIEDSRAVHKRSLEHINKSNPDTQSMWDILQLRMAKLETMSVSQPRSNQLSNLSHLSQPKKSLKKRPFAGDISITKETPPYIIIDDPEIVEPVKQRKMVENQSPKSFTTNPTSTSTISTSTESNSTNTSTENTKNTMVENGRPYNPSFVAFKPRPPHAPGLPQHDASFTLNASLVNALLPSSVAGFQQQPPAQAATDTTIESNELENGDGSNKNDLESNKNGSENNVRNGVEHGVRNGETGEVGMEIEVESGEKTVSSPIFISIDESEDGRSSPVPPAYEIIPEHQENLDSLEQAQQKLLKRQKAKKVEETVLTTQNDSIPTPAAPIELTPISTTELTPDQVAKLNVLLKGDLIYDTIQNLEKSQIELETSLDRKKNMLRARHMNMRADMTKLHQQRTDQASPAEISKLIDQNAKEWNELGSIITRESQQFDAEVKSQMDAQVILQQRTLEAVGVPSFSVTTNSGLLELQKSVLDIIVASMKKRKETPPAKSKQTSPPTLPSLLGSTNTSNNTNNNKSNRRQKLHEPPTTVPTTRHQQPPHQYRSHEPHVHYSSRPTSVSTQQQPVAASFHASSYPSAPIHSVPPTTPHVPPTSSYNHPTSSYAPLGRRDVYPVVPSNVQPSSSHNEILQKLQNDLEAAKRQAAIEEASKYQLQYQVPPPPRPVYQPEPTASASPSYQDPYYSNAAPYPSSTASAPYPSRPQTYQHQPAPVAPPSASYPPNPYTAPRQAPVNYSHQTAGRLPHNYSQQPYAHPQPSSYPPAQQPGTYPPLPYPHPSHGALQCQSYPPRR